MPSVKIALERRERNPSFPRLNLFAFAKELEIDQAIELGARGLDLLGASAFE
jgi:hypothetical protein